MAVQWGAIQQPNYFARAMEGYDAGRKMRSERETRQAANIFAEDPVEGTRAMIAAGRPDLASASMTAHAGGERLRARREASPHLARGDYGGAAKATAGIDPEFSRQLEGWDRERLDTMHTAGKRGAAIIMAASALADPFQRSEYIQNHTDELLRYGFKPEQIAGYDTRDQTKMRADAARFMEIGDIAGKVATEKFGDYAVTYATDPIRGTRAVSKTEIPETRADRRQREEFDWKKKIDLERLRQDAEREERLGREASDPASSPAKVVAPLYQKLVDGQPLTPSEERALYFYRLDPITADAMKPEGGAGEPTRAPAPAGRPAPARPAPNRSAAPTQAAPQDPAQRRPNTVYSTPRGPLMWTGTGWVEAR